MPKFKFFLSNTNNPVRKGDLLWSTSIPLSRHHSSGAYKPDIDVFISYEDYFSAARDFLEKDRYEMIVQAVSRYLHRKISFREIEKIRIFLDKHGEFYHPAKVEVVLQDVKIPFVLNVAVTEAGKQCAQREYRLLQMLNVDYPDSFIPKVYARDNVFTKMNQVEIGMFLGEWFEGFSEFHMSLDPDDKKHKIIVWDSKQGNFFLTTQQAMDLYRQAAMILTYYYNVETFEQIFSWHHAAGDFVVKCRKENVELKLVTVRQYRSMFANNIAIKNSDSHKELILEALLVFFLNMAIKMRIDRLDGVGEIVWSDDVALKGILKGFFDALALKPESSVVEGPLNDGFRQHLLACSPADFFDLNHTIFQTYPSQAPEVPVIRQHLEKHVEGLYNNIRQLEKM
ncbi:MAG: hypothetical protein JRE65_04010 [Deltaproteobacteria bacterium]|jgi:hypothetical protein|nr:hypothetical protein [Deltaproteobacteria bacterium]